MGSKVVLGVTAASVLAGFKGPANSRRNVSARVGSSRRPALSAHSETVAAGAKMPVRQQRQVSTMAVRARLPQVVGTSSLRLRLALV